MKKESGFSKIILVLIIVAIFVGAGFIIKEVVKDINKATDVEEQYLQVQISEELNSKLSNKLVEASKAIAGTSNDISTVYYENKLIDEYLLVEGFIKADENSTQVNTVNDTGKVYKIYYINVEMFSDEENLYGKGTSLETGDVFTLEPIITTLEDGTEKSTGKYELKYYDVNKKVSIVDEVDLYATNKT